jgi:acyl-CoA-binding protein
MRLLAWANALGRALNEAQEEIRQFVEQAKAGIEQ